MRKGYEILLMAPRSQHHKGKPTLDAVLEIAKQHDIRRYTRRTDTESTGRREHVHAAHFFELVDEPEELTFVLGAHRANELLRALKAEAIHVFCVCRTIEFGHLDEPDPVGEDAPIAR